MPNWKATEYRRRLNYPIILTLIALIYFYFALIGFIDQNDILQLFNFLTSTMILFFIAGRLYCEYYATNDFIDISRTGIKFRETPALGQGWLPKTQELIFDEIKTVDIVKIKNVFTGDKENIAIFLVPIKGRTIIVGSRLDQNQIMKIGLALKGSVALSNTLQRFIKNEGQVKEIIDTAKEIWSSFKSRENGND